MGILDEVFDFFFGWLITDPPKPEFQGQEVTIQKPTNAQLVYGKVFNQKGQIVRSEVIDSTVTDIPNELMYVQVVWSAGAIQSIDNVYLNEILHTDERYAHPNGGSYVTVYNVPNGGGVTFEEPTAVSGGTLTFDGNGHAYSVIRLQIAPEKMPNFPNITADLSGRLIENLSTGVTEFSDNYADVLWDYLTSPYGRGIRVSRLDKPSFLTERSFTETLVDRFDGDTQQQKLMSCNVALDGNKKVLDNVNIIRKGCRGFLPYVDGKFQFIIEHERDPIAFEITDDNRMGDLTIEDSALNEHYNKVTVKYRDKEQQGKEVSVVYPEDNSTYLIEDNNVPLETTVTLETVNNEYEAKQAAEIIFNRSRNTLKAKYTCKSEGRVVNVGNVMNISNAAFGLSQKPFIVNNKKVRASGIVEFELIEYQSTIYPWVAKTEQVIPDSTIPDYSTVTPVTSLAVEYTYDELSQARVTWSSTHSSFNVFIVDSSGDRTSLGVTANKFILLDALEVDTYTVEVYAINGLGYTSAKTQLAIEITRPSTPALSSDPVGSFLYVRPVSLDVGYDYHFEFYYGLTDTGNEPNTTTLNRAPDGTFMDVVEGIVANTTYYVYHRIVTRFGNGAWVKNTVVSGDGIPLSQLEPDVQTSISRASSGAELDQAISQISDDLIVQDQNVEIAIANKAIDDMLTIISQGRERIENITEIARLNTLIVDLDTELGKVTVEGGQITASEIAAIQVELDAFNAEITALAVKQTEIDGTVTTHSSELLILSDSITALQTTIGGLDFDALVLRMDSAENSIEQAAISATTANVDLMSDIVSRGIDAIELLEATENLALAQTKIQANTTEIEATASQVTTVATVANDGYALAQSALSSVSNESEQRASDVTLLQAEIDDRKSEINEVSQALVDETSARATDVSTLQTNIDNEAGTRAAEITSVNDAITTESQVRASADNTLQANIDTETGLREAAITSTNTAIADETSARVLADNALQANIDTETGLREAAITNTNTAIADETSARVLADNTLQANIDSEATTRGAAITAANQAIADETSARALADTTLQANIDSEATARNAAIGTVNQAITDEAGARASADTTLQANIDTETGLREAAITNTNQAIADETSARALADTTLQANIDSETTARNAAIGTVNQAITDEAGARASADTTLQANIDSEAGTRAAEITSVNQAIANESSARASLETTLQADINGRATLTQLQAVEDKADGNTTAVNNLSGQVNNPTSGLSAAFSLAQSAETTANGAASSATTAQNTANTANNTASSALSLASTVDDRTENIAEFALATDVNGFTSGIYNQNDGTTASFKIKTNAFEIVDSTSNEVVFSRVTEGWQFAGIIIADSGDIGGWLIEPTMLRSAGSGARIEMNSDKNRIGIFDNINEKVAMGYLDGLPKNSGSGNWTSSDYGFWARDGDKLVIDGDTEYVNGDWIVQNDATVRIHNASGNDVLTLGTDSGEKGLFLFDGSAARNLLSKFTTNEIYIGDGNSYLRYQGGNLTFTGTLSGANGTFSGSLSGATGTFSGSLSAATGTFSGSLSAATGTFSGSLSGASGTFTGTVSAGLINGGRILTPSINTLSNGESDTSKPWSVLADGTFVNRWGGYRFMIGERAGASGSCAVWFGGAVSQSQRTTGNATFALTTGGEVFAQNAVIAGKIHANNGLSANYNAAYVEAGRAYDSDGDTVSRSRIGYNDFYHSYVQIDSGGVDIVGNGGTAYPITMYGNVSARNDLTVSGTFTESSDERLKENINSINGVLGNVCNLEPKTYNKINSEQIEAGLIAQEVEQLFPDCVMTDPDTGYKSIAYTRLIPYLISSIKELSALVKG